MLPNSQTGIARFSCPVARLSARAGNGRGCSDSDRTARGAWSYGRGIGPSRASGSGYRCGGGAGSKHDGAKWFSHGFSSSSGSLPQRRAAGISRGDSRVLPDACRQSGAGLCQPCVARDGAVEKLCAGAPDGRQACDCSTVFGRAAVVAGDLTGLIVEKRLG